MGVNFFLDVSQNFSTWVSRSRADHVQIPCVSSRCLLRRRDANPAVDTDHYTIEAAEKYSLEYCKDEARPKNSYQNPIKVFGINEKRTTDVSNPSGTKQWVQEARIRNQKKLFHVELFSEHDRVRSSFFTSALWLKGCTSWSWIIQTVILGMGYTEDELYRR